MTIYRAALGWALLVLMPGLPCSVCATQDADLILHHGRIVTVDRAFSIRQALAVKDGRIIRIGTDEEVLAARGPRTTLVDLDGKMVLPGLIDSHVHPTAASVIEFDHPDPGDGVDSGRARLHSPAGRRAWGWKVGRRPSGVHHATEGTAIPDPR